MAESVNGAVTSRRVHRTQASDPVTPVPGPGDDGFEIGVGLDLPFSAGWRDETSIEVLRELGGDEGPSVRQLVAMRRTDGQARALYRLLTLPIRSALRNSTFVAAEGGDAEAEFITQVFTLPASGGGMTVPLHRFVAQTLMSVFDGFAAFEKVYWQPRTGPLKGKWTLKKLAHRPPETLTFLADRTGGFAGLHQRASFAGHTVDVDIPRERSYYFACQEEERKFYGVSMFQSAFYHYDKKVKLYYVAHLAAQRAAVGTRKGRMPRGASPTNKNDFVRALADLGVAQYIALPGPDWDVESLREGGTFDFLSYINHHNSQMSKSLLAGFFDTNQGGGSSDTSLVDFGQESDAMFLLMLQTLMDELAEGWNTHLIPELVEWNFGTDRYPKFTWGTFTDEQREAVRSTFSTLATAGEALRTTPEFVFELERKMADELGLEIDYEALEAEMVEDKERKREAAKVAQERLLDPTKDPTSVYYGPSGPTGPGGSSGSQEASQGAQEPSGAQGAPSGASTASKPAGGRQGRGKGRSGAETVKLTVADRVGQLADELLALAAREGQEPVEDTVEDSM